MAFKLGLCANGQKSGRIFNRILIQLNWFISFWFSLILYLTLYIFHAYLG